MYQVATYNANYYLKQDLARFASARAVLSEFFRLYHPSSIADFGCGLGHWLAVCQKDFAIADLHGYDGNAVPDKFFKIDPAAYTQADFEKPLTLPRRFDLAMTIEVAEHLPAQAAENFVTILTSASDVVLFSAAAPWQGGVNHFNEQPPAYWAELFAQKDYLCFDILRDLIWEKPEATPVHCQNILVFVHKNKSELLTKQGFTPIKTPQLKYHPRFVSQKLKKRYLRRQKVQNFKNTLLSLFGLAKKPVRT